MNNRLSAIAAGLVAVLLAWNYLDERQAAAISALIIPIVGWIQDHKHPASTDDSQKPTTP